MTVLVVEDAFAETALDGDIGLRWSVGQALGGNVETTSVTSHLCSWFILKLPPIRRL